jgi:hypothetical protein
VKKLYWSWDIYRNPTIEMYQLDINDFLVPCSASSSSWFSGLPSFIDGSKSYKELFQKMTKSMMENFDKDKNHIRWFPKKTVELKTMKTCPGVHEVFYSSFIVKCPLDVKLRITETLDILHVETIDSELLELGSHEFIQMKSKNNLFRGRFNVKFTLPVVLKNDYNIPYVFLNPTYHHNPVWDVIPGVINKQFSKGIPLIVNTLINVNDLNFKDGIASLDISKGTPLSYIWFPEKMKLTESKKPIKSPPRTYV